jgi:hypothetical protein
MMLNFSILLSLFFILNHFIAYRLPNPGIKMPKDAIIEGFPWL